ATNQVRYNLLDRKPVQNGVLDFCQRHNILLTAYSPLKGGVLSNSTVAAIAQKHGVPPGQVAIQWLIQQPGVITIPKSTNVNHLQDNLDALKLGLDEEDLGLLDMIDD
ncbi:MAG: aldo/keto reductase, partial [Caldilineaceae bacterium]|nr:aldo/keto reductase [Caldilineaceae bacterium]